MNKPPLSVTYIPRVGDVIPERILVAMSVDEAHQIAAVLAAIPSEPRSALRTLTSKLLRVASEHP